jgi:hypothetical protein
MLRPCLATSWPTGIALTSAAWCLRPGRVSTAPCATAARSPHATPADTASGGFSIGALGVLLRRSPLIVLLSLEIMLNGANLALIAFSRCTATATARSSRSP